MKTKINFKNFYHISTLFFVFLFLLSIVYTVYFYGAIYKKDIKDITNSEMIISIAYLVFVAICFVVFTITFTVLISKEERKYQKEKKENKIKYINEKEEKESLDNATEIVMRKDLKRSSSPLLIPVIIFSILCLLICILAWSLLANSFPIASTLGSWALTLIAFFKYYPIAVFVLFSIAKFGVEMFYLLSVLVP